MIGSFGSFRAQLVSKGSWLGRYGFVNTVKDIDSCGTETVVQYQVYFVSKTGGVQSE